MSFVHNTPRSIKIVMSTNKTRYVLCSINRGLSLPISIQSAIIGARV